MPKTQRNYCVILKRDRKSKYFGNLNVKNVTDNKKIWKNIALTFSSTKTINENMLLWLKNILITDEKSFLMTTSPR